MNKFKRPPDFLLQLITKNNMNNKYFALALAPALMIVIATQADARFGGEQNGERSEERAAMHQLMETVTRSVEKTTNGVVMTMSATDAEAIAALQEHAVKRAGRERENVTVAITNTANGVVITTTTDDAEQLVKMHERADNPGQGHGGKGGKRGEHGDQLDIERTITNLSNGVEITMTSTDADVVTKMQEREVREPKNDEVSVSKTNIANGVITTITTTNADMVERIQARAEGGKGARGGKGGRGGQRGEGRQGGERGQQ